MNTINHDNLNTFLQLFAHVKDIFLGLIGGVVAYLVKYRKEKEISIHTGQIIEFDFMILFTNMILGGFMSYLVGTLIDPHTTGRDFILGSVGISSYAIAIFIESKFAKIIIDKIFANLDPSIEYEREAVNDIKKNTKKRGRPRKPKGDSDD